MAALKSKASPSSPMALSANCARAMLASEGEPASLLLLASISLLIRFVVAPRMLALIRGTSPRGEFPDRAWHSAELSGPEKTGDRRLHSAVDEWDVLRGYLIQNAQAESHALGSSNMPANVPKIHW